MGLKKSMISVFMLMLVALVATAVSALDITITEVELDDDTLDPTADNFIRDIERGDEFEVKVHLTANEVAFNVEVEAAIRGVHNEGITDITDTFDVKAGTSYVKTLTLELPRRMDMDTYLLRVRIQDRAGTTVEETYTLDVSTARDMLVIRDVVLSPGNVIQAGRALLATVRVKNYGLNDEKDVKVTVRIPELGLSASDYVEEIEGRGEDESASSEELYLRIPGCADAGTYLLEVEVEYDDGDEVTRETRTITVTEGDYCPTGYVEPAEETAMTVITVGATTQDVTRGVSGTIYPITVTNQGTLTVTYTIGVDVAGNWATVQMSPSNVATVPSGATSTVYVYVSANENAAAGENMFSVTVSKGGKMLKQVAMKANVVEPSAGVTVTGWTGLKRALEIALVVLVVLLVIFGLIVGFNKLKRTETEDEEGEGKTYY